MATTDQNQHHENGWSTRITMGVCGGLLWIFVVVIPYAFVGGLLTTEGLNIPLGALVLLPFPVLLFALFIRSLSAALCGFPATLLLAAIWNPEITSDRVYGEWPFLAVILVGAAYFWTAAHIQQTQLPTIEPWMGWRKSAERLLQSPFKAAHLFLLTILLGGLIAIGVFLLPKGVSEDGQGLSGDPITLLVAGMLTWLSVLFVVQVPTWRRQAQRRHGDSSHFGVELRQLWRDTRPSDEGLGMIGVFMLLAGTLLVFSSWL